MNEIIKELLAKATHTVTDYQCGIDSSVTVIDQQLFAHLVVRECAEICLQVAERNLGKGNTERSAAAIESAREIINRFEIKPVA